MCSWSNTTKTGIYTTQGNYKAGNKKSVPNIKIILGEVGGNRKIILKWFSINYIQQCCNYGIQNKVFLSHQNNNCLKTPCTMEYIPVSIA